MRTLAKTAEFETEIKKSRFISYAGRVDDIPSAMSFIEQHSHVDAGHNCWAYRIGSDYRFNDDGEPAGTAGKPIFSAIDGSGLDHVAVLVVRYFGGIKLGAGGLVRAYGGSASSCLGQSQIVVVVPRILLDLIAPFGQLGSVYQLLDRFAAERLAEDYQVDGVRLRLELPEADVEELKSALADATRGTAQLKVTRTPGSDAA